MSCTMGAYDSANMMLMRDELSTKEACLAMLIGGHKQLTSFQFRGLANGNINASNVASKRSFWPEGIEVEVSNNVELSDNKMGACMGSPRLKKRKVMTAEQVKSLEVSFGVDSKLEPEKKQRLAEKLGLQPRQVAVWFQNRRAKWKTKQLEQEFRTLKSQYHRMLSETAQLKSEVARLTAELDRGKGGGATTVEGASRELAKKGASTLRDQDNTSREATQAKVDHHIVVQADQMNSIDWGNVIKQHSVSPTCSDYSGIVHGGSTSFRQGDASLVETRDGRPLFWKEESFLDGPSTSTNILTDCSLSNHIAMDWLWELTT